MSHPALAATPSRLVSATAVCTTLSPTGADIDGRRQRQRLWLGRAVQTPLPRVVAVDEPAAAARRTQQRTR